jgi:3-oxoacyl-[acyl-carrier protein] reductase
LIDVDVLGTIDLSRLVADRLIEQSSAPPPAMVFIGWDQASQGMEGDAGQMFGTVKAAITAFAASLAQTVAPHVRVNTVAPGWIKTSWGEASSDYWDHRAQSQSLMHRWGKPDDVAKAVLFAADPGNSFLNGQTIDLNGGWNRRG